MKRAADAWYSMDERLDPDAICQYQASLFQRERMKLAALRICLGAVRCRVVFSRNQQLGASMLAGMGRALKKYRLADTDNHP